jgi:argininosuccinate lyase
MALWNNGEPLEQLLERFTVGDDRAMDERMARWDVVGSIAHVEMLCQVGLITASDRSALIGELENLLMQIDGGEFRLDDDVEDIHSHVERVLTQRLGETGKKVHTARSRNDQVLVDLKLFLRHELRQLRGLTLDTADALLHCAEHYRDTFLPGMTHYQVAMPSSFGLWFGGHAEALLEDVRVLDMSIDAANANPLGSAAGYGSSFPIDRAMTTAALNFDRMHVTSTFAQMSRGRTERLAAVGIAQVASTLARFAQDAVLYLSDIVGWCTLPAAATTGSSIMPHKKNPDVFEVLRGRANRLQSLPAEITHIMTNLPSGYHRDLQFVKDRIIPAIDELALCLEVVRQYAPLLQPNDAIAEQPRYAVAYTVERVHDLVRHGMAFRDAYHLVASEVSAGTFVAPEHMETTHLGSVSNPGLEVLRLRLGEERAV